MTLPLVRPNMLNLEAMLVGRSLVMQRLRSRIARVAPSALAVLIQGPTGAGKELVAQAVHWRSGRTGPFVPFNVSVTTDTMADDTLFGHVKGAFTGATEARAGLLAQAHRGTLFLDEISTLPLHLQPKLLRAIETHEFRPLGGRRDEASDFRLVAASNEDLTALAEANRFRADLIYRLNGILIEVPPLAERREDIDELAHYFLADHCRADALWSLTPQALRVLEEYAWPGNVRELQQVIARARLFAATSVIDVSDILDALDQGRSAEQGKSAPLEALGDLRVERSRLLAVLEAVRWDTTQAAARLAVSRGTVYRRMQRLGIAPRRLYPPRAVGPAPSPPSP